MFYSCTGNHPMNSKYSKIRGSQLNNLLFHLFQNMEELQKKCTCGSMAGCGSSTHKVLLFAFEEAYISGNLPIFFAPVEEDQIPDLIEYIQESFDRILLIELERMKKDKKVSGLTKRILSKIKLTFTQNIQWDKLETQTQVLVLSRKSNCKEYIVKSQLYQHLQEHDLLGNFVVFYGVQDDYDNDVFINAFSDVVQKTLQNKRRNAKKQIKRKRKQAKALDLYTPLDENGIPEIDE